MAAVLLLGPLFLCLKGVTRENLFFVVSLAAVLGLVYLLRRRGTTAYFTADYLYVHHHQDEEVVPLHLVQEIRITDLKVNYRPLWEIVFIDRLGEIRSVEFFPAGDQQLRQFVQLVLAQNPDVQYLPQPPLREAQDEER